MRYSGHGVFHGIEHNQLLGVSQVVVAVDQVLQVLADFFHKRERERFVLDSQFAFLRLIAHHSSRTEILATYRVLQHHTSVASKHLVQQISSLTRMYGTDSDQMSVSSYESTRASLRSIFGSRSARKEAGKLLARPEYFNKMPDDLTEIAAYLRGRAFRDRQAPKEFTIHRSHGVRKPERAESDISRNSLTPTTGLDLARNLAASEGQGVRFVTDPPIPTSISALLSKRHAVTRLPGAGRIGVSAVGTSSVKTMTTNNGPETAASSAYNDSLRVPAASKTRIPSPKSWTSYTFRHRNNPEESSQTPLANENNTCERTPVPRGNGPPSGGGSSPPSNDGNQEEKPTRTDPTLLIPGMILLEGTEVTEEVEEAEEEEAGAEEETTGIPTLKTLAIPHGGVCRKNGKSTIN